MSQNPEQPPVGRTRRVTLTFDKELGPEEMEQLRQNVDALAAAMAAPEAAHHHDVTRMF
jgi:hypothetical protein